VLYLSRTIIKLLKAFRKWEPKWTTCYNIRDRFIPLLKGPSRIVSPRGNLAMRMLRSRRGPPNRIRSCHLCPRAMEDARCQKLSTAPMTQLAQIIALVMRLVLPGMSTVRLLAKSWKKHLPITKNGRNSTTMWRKRRKLKCARIWSISENANLAKTVVLPTILVNSKRKSTFQATTWRSCANNSTTQRSATATTASGASSSTQSTIGESLWDTWKACTKEPV